MRSDGKCGGGLCSGSMCGRDVYMVVVYVWWYAQ